MGNTSKQTDHLSRREIAYYRRRQQNRLFAQIAQFFSEEAEAGRITRKGIADKLDKDPAQVTRWLSGPANFELDTISDWLLTMGAEMDTNIVRFVDRAKPNFAHPLTISAQATSTSVLAVMTASSRTFSSETFRTIDEIEPQKESVSATNLAIEVTLKHAAF